MTKHKKKKLKIKDPKRSLILLAVVFIIITIIINKNNSIKKKEKMSLIINNRDVIETLENEIDIQGEVVYLEFNDIKKCIDSNIYMEESKIIATSDKKISMLEIGKDTMEINGEEVQIKGKPFKKDEKIYLPISEMQNAYDIQFLYVPEYKNIVIDNYSKKMEKADVKKDSLIKEEKKTFSENIDKVKKGNWVVYISEEDGWAKIRTQNGNLGYIKKSKLTNFVTEREEMQEEEKTTKNISYKKDITKKNIEKYEQRKKVIQELLTNAVFDKEKSINIIYKKEEAEAFKKFKLEAKAILKECGITAVFNN